MTKAPVAQLDRVPGYEPGGHTFESCRAHHMFGIKKAVDHLVISCFFVFKDCSIYCTPRPGYFGM